MVIIFSLLSICGLLAWGVHLYHRAGQIERRLAKQHKLQTRMER
jgi:hypothetical protein